MRPPAEIGISQKWCGVFTFKAAFFIRGLKEHCCHNFCFDPCTCANVTSVDSANRLMPHYIQYMQPQSSLLQLAAMYLRMPTANLFNQGMTQPGCMNHVCSMRVASTQPSLSPLLLASKGLVAPKYRNQVFPACTDRRFCILLVFRATAETRGITAETRGITAETRAQPVDVLGAFDCVA